jgi:hypothetical protein
LVSMWKFDDRAKKITVRHLQWILNRSNVSFMVLGTENCTVIPRKELKRVPNASDDEYWGFECLRSKKIVTFVRIVLIRSKNEYPIRRK